MRPLLILALVWPIPAALAVADATAVASSSASPAVPTQLIQSVGDAILANHIDPPSRQEMILNGIRAVSEAAGVPTPGGLGRRVSAIVSAEDFARLVEETWPRLPEKKDVTPEKLTRAFLEGMLQEVQSPVSLRTAKEAKVDEQIRGNLYVGIHVQVGFDENEKRLRIAGIIDGGPAQRAGVRVNDLVDEVDGKDTRGMSVTEVLDRLRGEEGTDVEVVFRQAKSNETRRLTIRRARLFVPTIKGIRARDSGGWDVRIDESASVGYLRIESIRGSTPHELRQFARQLEAEKLRALVLDLRTTHDADVHSTVLLADELLDGGAIGRVRTVDRVTTYQAQADALFRGWPLAVLIDRSTAGPAEWLAAALQDNHRAVLVGAQTRGDPNARSYVPVAGGEWALEMISRSLERADGRPIAGRQPVWVGFGRGMPRRVMGRLEPAGVKPDHPPDAPEVKVSPGRPGVRPAPVAEPGSEDSPDYSVREALRLLGETLKTAGDE